MQHVKSSKKTDQQVEYNFVKKNCIKKREYQALRTKAVSSQGYFKHKTKTKTFQDHKCRYSKLSNAGLQLTTACHRDHNQIVHSYIHKNLGGVYTNIYIHVHTHHFYIHT